MLVRCFHFPTPSPSFILFPHETHFTGTALQLDAEVSIPDTMVAESKLIPAFGMAQAPPPQFALSHAGRFP